MNKLTAVESHVIDLRLNAADAHARFTPSTAFQHLILDELPNLFESARKRDQRDLDMEAFVSFQRLGNQNASIENPHVSFYPCYSSSVALEIAANSLSGTYASALVQHPTFDNIPDILRRNRIIPLPWDFYHQTEFDAERTNLWVLTAPNNPTGTVLGRGELVHIATSAAARGGMVIVDASFRLFCEGARYDYYEVLLEAGCDFIVIEDTGKIWPTLDLKLGFLCTSAKYEGTVRDTYDDILLNVPPFTSQLVARISQYPQLLEEVHALIKANRTSLRTALSTAHANQQVHFPFPSSEVSVDLLQFQSPEERTALLNQLLVKDVALLPSDSFWWSISSLVSRSSVRIALARDPEIIDEVARAIAEHLEACGSETMSGST